MRPLSAIGVLAVLIGFLVLFDRGLAETIDLSSLAVTLVGVLGLVQGIRYMSARRGRERRRLETGEPERRERATVPGREVDELIDRVSDGSHRRYESRRRLRSRVRSIAIATVARARNRSSERAAELVETGAWTEDPVAAAFLAPDISYPLRLRLRTRLVGRTPYRAGLAAAIDEIERIDSEHCRVDDVGPETADEPTATAEATR